MFLSGFTIIELLVVIALIGLTSSIVMVRLGGPRDSARIAKILQFQSSLHNLLGADIVGWWNFNHGTNSPCGTGMVCDISGKNNHGIIYTATYTEGVPGTGGYAMEFDGSDDYIFIDPFNELKGATSFTFSFWAKIKEEQGYVFSRFNGFWVANGLMAPVGQYRACFHLDGAWRSTYDWPYAINRWEYTVLTWDGTNTRVYQNGVIVIDSTADSAYNAMSNNNAVLVISGIDNSSLNGSIDDFRIYKRSLTAGEIQSIYAETKNKYLAQE